VKHAEHELPKPNSCLLKTHQPQVSSASVRETDAFTQKPWTCPCSFALYQSLAPTLAMCGKPFLINATKAHQTQMNPQYRIN